MLKTVYINRVGYQTDNATNMAAKWASIDAQKRNEKRSSCSGARVNMFQRIRSMGDCCLGMCTNNSSCHWSYLTENGLRYCDFVQQMLNDRLKMTAESLLSD